jgi:3-methylcrotonyl-CoA carboxylase alpha subunit
MFKKILIANRGEIALRIMRTCREMGIQTVAVYSEADRSARHVREADEAYFIGPAPATQSYLRIDTLINVARQSGAEAIHPGYGFLSENADFVEACEEAGIVFIGPPAHAMRLMGSKIAAKQLAQSVGAPIVPGYTGESQDDDTLLREAERIGFPLLIKASAGGGGKGMREVHRQADFLAELAGARREAKASFGDDTVFLERLLIKPRHVEIQILGDAHGNMIYLGERECSIQRRHQKIVEESPSVALTPALRAEMGQAAVRIASAAGYVNAGTMEFILDSDRHFYFLEMNTRLQVEHPVTELVTGFDLVRHQLRIAAGEPLGITQEQVTQRGHAIEVRIYAEDPQRQFLPSTGTVSTFVEPQGPGVRVDSGIESGDEITQYYDPMIAKLIVYGEDRPAAIARLQRSLAETAIFGVTTNIPLLYDIACHPAFSEGYTHTAFLDEHGLLAPQQDVTLPDEVLIAAALYENQLPSARQFPASNGNPWHMLGPWRMLGEARIFTYLSHEQEYTVSLTPVLTAQLAQSSNSSTFEPLKAQNERDLQNWHVRLNGKDQGILQMAIGNSRRVVLIRGVRQQRLFVERQTDTIQVSLNGRRYQLALRQPPDVEVSARGSGSLHSQKTLTAPMAGTIVKVQTQDNQQVAARQVLVILSAMKMEHTITAPYDGKVRHVSVKEGDVVKGGAVLVEME